MPSKFSQGVVVMTPGAQAEATSDEMIRLLARHASGDWGDVDREDRKANDDALKSGERLMSVYKRPGREAIWIITEWDRSVTTVLIPSEY